ncbi:energy transducer TonB [Flavobacterium luminosum]|uniref:Energy transducer TonB n=1 Tax=Flavobacterium luminosum TaxID=2949086 RepID=A0ABT0TJV7_9FLAO|nr:energy transducer TonB [Flavobacterium sp. HXWNR70]MCL9807777.1 energy transducer TonB [Flavobacterium sp. HXWNR70]
MSKLNITKTEWLELVFEGKNKEYGAYQLRREQGETTLKAFFTALVFLASLILLPVLLSSFVEKEVIPEPKIIIDERIVVADLREIKEIPKKKEEFVKRKAAAAQVPITTQNLINPTVVEASQAPEVEFTKPQDIGKPTSEDANASLGSGASFVNGSGTDSVGETVKTPEIMTTATVDKSPLFPGGINAFLQIVGSRFKTPEMDEGKTVRVVVFFVVERDGSLSGITVPKNPGFGLDQEAIRVLKSIKTKWEPGMYQGQTVRTQYSLPIVVQMQ